MSDRFGISSPKIKHSSRGLLIGLLTGLLMSTGAWASTNEDLSAPPVSDAPEPAPMRHPLLSPQKTEQTSKTQDASSVVPPAKEVSKSIPQKPADAKISLPSALPAVGSPAVKATVDQSAKTQPTASTPSVQTPKTKSDAKLAVEAAPAATQAEKSDSVHEWLKTMALRAERIMRDVQQKSDETDRRYPLPSEAAAEDAPRQADEMPNVPEAGVVVSNTVWTGQPALSEADLKQIRAQLEGGLAHRPQGQSWHLEKEASSDEASQEHDGRLRLPPMD